MFYMAGPNKSFLREMDNNKRQIMEWNMHNDYPLGDCAGFAWKRVNFPHSS